MFTRAHVGGAVFINSATNQTGVGSTLAINKPTNTAQADIMVSLVCQNGSAVTWTGDTSWTEVIDQGSIPSIRIAYLVAGASEGASYTFTASGSGGNKGGGILTYRNAGYDTVGAISASGTTCVAPSITVAQDGSLLLAIFMSKDASDTFTAPTGMTAVASDTDATSPSWAVFSQSVDAGATGTRTSTLATAGFGVLLSLKP